MTAFYYEVDNIITISDNLLKAASTRIGMIVRGLIAQTAT